jgi:hypothetical protein
MKKFLTFIRKPLVWTDLLGSIVGSVLSDAEVTTSTPSHDTLLENIGLLLVIAAGVVLTIQIWSLWLKGKFLGNTKTVLRKIGGISISAALAIAVVGIIGVQGQTIRLAVDSGENSRHKASVLAAAEEQKALEDIKVATKLEASQAAEDLKQSQAEEKKKSAQAKVDEQKAKEDAKNQAETDKVNAFNDSKNMKNGGFTDVQIKTLGLFSKLMSGYVEVYSEYLVGTSNIATVQFGCSKLEESYSVLGQVSSSSPYFEDLLDRAKDYYYEAKSTCAHAFKKNRIDEIQESSTNAATARGFFERILKEIKK